MEDWGYIKCKDHFIIKLRFYASPYYMKLMRSGNSIGNVKNQQAAEDYHRFFWKFIEFVTKKTDKHFHLNYMLRGSECAVEEIYETHGIYQSQSNGYYTFIIPNRHVDIIEWVKSNVYIPYKILQKTSVGMICLTPEKWRREMYKTPNNILEKLN